MERANFFIFGDPDEATFNETYEEGTIVFENVRRAFVDEDDVELNLHDY